MWIFTDLGFFSLTRSRQEPDKIQARARCRTDAQNLARYVSEMLDIAPPRVIETPEADYRFRVILEPAAAAVVMAAMVEKIEYSNFKSHIETTLQKDKLDALHHVWSIMNQYQRNKLEWEERERQHLRNYPSDRPIGLDPVARYADWSGPPRRVPRLREPLEIIDDRTHGEKVADGDAEALSDGYGRKAVVMSWKLKGTKRKGRWSAAHYTLDGKVTLCGLKVPGEAREGMGLGDPCLRCNKRVPSSTEEGGMTWNEAIQQIHGNE